MGVIIALAILLTAVALLLISEMVDYLWPRK